MVPSDEFASSPCSWHEFDIDRWRREQRRYQIDARRAIPSERRAELDARIIERLDQIIDRSGGASVSLYSPMRGEPDLRPLLARIVEDGRSCALPVVVERGQPLVFRQWAPGDRLERGIWNIPVPAEGREFVPDVIVAPVVAFDRERYRLGYGGGYFDRTLAVLPGQRLVIGVGYARAAIDTIHPQPHDIPMTMIVTESELIG